MTDARTAANARRFVVRITADTHFGWLRTRLSLERTIMSWLRTAVALIGFGFAIVQYLFHLEQEPGARSAYLPHAPQYLGLALIFMRHPGARDFDLAVPVGHSLPMG